MMVQRVHDKALGFAIQFVGKWRMGSRINAAGTWVVQVEGEPERFAVTTRRLNEQYIPVIRGDEW